MTEITKKCFFTFALFAFGSTSLASDARTYNYYRASCSVNNHHILVHICTWVSKSGILQNVMFSVMGKILLNKAPL